MKTINIITPIIAAFFLSVVAYHANLYTSHDGFSKERHKNSSKIKNHGPNEWPNLESEENPFGYILIQDESEDKENFEAMREVWEKAFNSEINFWGKVVDTEGEPIVGAKIKVIVYDDSSWNLDGESKNSKYFLEADENGKFSLLDKKGAAISVTASLDGYDKYINKEDESNMSRVRIDYAGEDDNLRIKRPTEENPTVLVLRKKKELANLMIKKKDFVELNKNGEMKNVSLKNDEGKGVDFEFQLWSDSPVPFNYDRYDWSAEIRVDKGLIQPVTEKNPVEAPLDGYQEEYKIVMEKDMDPNDWSSTNFRPVHFWVKLDSGNYAKAKIEFETGREEGVGTKIWYNLDGTRNFEGWDK